MKRGTTVYDITQGRVTEPETPKIAGVRHRVSLCDVCHGRRPSL